MLNSISTTLSRQVALQSQMDMVANNIANMSTPGFRGQSMVFKEYVNNPPLSAGKENPSDNLSQVEDYGQYHDTSQGPLQKTNNPLDVAIQGPGWFGVQTGSGIRYTRDGSFSMDAQGDLTDSTGQKIATAGGGSIVIPPNSQYVKITQSGQVMTERGSIGQLMVVGFASEQDMIAQGNGLYDNTTDQPTPVTNPSVIQGALEGSNVNPVLEMTKMLNVSRAYESTMQMMSDEHDREKSMIEQLTSNN
jgi:flagellar basal-body rod protein FlgF